MATDDIWKRDEIDSPCVKICVIHPAAGICVGCYRSGDEIASWSRLAPGERSAITAELPQRAKLLTQRRKPRQRRTIPSLQS